MRKHLPDKNHFLNPDLRLARFPNHSITEIIDSGCNSHVYKARNPSIEGDLAFKFVPVENLPDDVNDRDSYLEEAKKANVLENSCVVKYVDVVPYKDLDLQRNFIVFVCNYVSGPSLRKYVKTNHQDISIEFVEDFLKTMFNLLYELQQRNMKHGDLHSGNIIVSKSEYDLSGATTFKVTDFGIAEVTGIEHGNDFLFIAGIVRELLLYIEYEDLDSRDRYVYNIIKQDYLKRHLIEIDPIADPLACNPWEMNSKLQKMDDKYREAHSEHVTTHMVTPFDYPNCEQMGSSHLLLKNLYSERLLGITEIKTRSNLVLTGPRGCGKTTVFRALSLDYLISVDADKPDDLDFLGIYYRCDDLYFSFPRYEAPERKDAVDIPMHFFVVSLIAETLRHFFNWAKCYFPEELNRKSPALIKELCVLVNLPKPEGPDSGSLSPLIAKLTKQRKRAAKKQRLCHIPGESIEGYMGPEVLLDFCKLFMSTFTFLRERPFYFFIDDYSTPKITAALQRNLNRLLMHRSPHIFFKISTESPISYERRDIDGKSYAEEREYDLLNLGLRYLTHEGNQVQTFLEDLFKRRFDEVNEFPCKSLKELLGSFPRNENELAREFRQNRGRNSYCGVETITAMCSGDIHYMIRLVGRMVEDAGGTDALRSDGMEPRISEELQSNTVRAAAGNFLESVRNLPRSGPFLAEIVNALGYVANSYLKYRNSGNEKHNPPHQASRIEPYTALKISDEAQDKLDDLIRFSIVLMDPRGKSRRGELVPRFYLRRYLIPHFNLTFSKRDSIELENNEIEQLLTDPRKFKEQKIGGDNQMDIFKSNDGAE